jgi:hypothetical protein
MANTFGVVSPNYQKIVAGSQLGTPALKFIEVAAVHSAAAVDFTKKTLAGAGAYTDSQSVMALAVNALQGFAEVYIVGVPSATEFVVAINDNTDNDGVVAASYSSMEAAILDAIGADTSVTITGLTLTGDDLV